MINPRTGIRLDTRTMGGAHSTDAAAADEEAPARHLLVVIGISRHKNLPLARGLAFFCYICRYARPHPTLVETTLPQLAGW